MDATHIDYETSAPDISQACLPKLAHLSLLSLAKQEVRFKLLPAVRQAAGPRHVHLAVGHLILD